MDERGLRTRWTDERLDDLARRVEGHDSWGPAVTGLETRVGQIAAELTSFRTEMRADLRELRTEAALARRWLVGLWATATLGVVGLLVEIALR